jgi:hypothetical protein
VSVTERDMGWTRIKDEIKKAEKAAVKVGVLSDSPQQIGEADMLLIAAANEFGTSDGHIPPRPYIRASFDAKQRELGRTQERLWNLVLDGKIDTDRAMGLLGEEHQAQIQEYMTALDTPPNAPRTVAKKGSSNPLIDEGRLRASIRWERQ